MPLHTETVPLPSHKQEPDLAQITLVISHFFAAPDAALFPAEIVAIILHTTQKSLAQMRSEGSGPKFLTDAAKKIFYKKKDIAIWLEHRLVSASNPKEARCFMAKRHETMLMT